MNKKMILEMLRDSLALSGAIVLGTALGLCIAVGAVTIIEKIG